MAPKGSPRMLLAASLLASNDGNIPVKVALSRAGFSAEEIAKEKKQRQARRRRDFLLKKKATTKIKGRRSMSTLPRSLPRNSKPVDLKDLPGTNFIHDDHIRPNQDTSRMDALIFACSMQKSISETMSQLPPSTRLIGDTNKVTSTSTSTSTSVPMSFRTGTNDFSPN